MNVALSFAEGRRAAGIATPLLAPIVLESPPPPRQTRCAQGRRKQRPDEPKAVMVQPVVAAPKVLFAEASSAPIAIELTAEQRTTWEAQLDRHVTEIMGPRYAPPGDPEEPRRLLAALEAAACLCEFVILASVSPPSELPPPPDPPEDQDPEEADSADDADEEITDLHRCAALGPTRELIAARAGITHKDILGDRERELIRRYQAGDRNAGEILLRAHAKFIGYFAKKYGKGRHDLEQEDVYAHAQIGFLEGVDRFEPERGLRLLTFAAHRIRSAVQRAVINTGTTIRVPVHMRGRQAEGKKYAEEAHRALFQARLDAPIGDEDGATLGDFVAALDDTEADIVSREWHDATAGLLDDALGNMPPRLADVLRRRAAGETLDQIAASYDVTKERIRQIEKNARLLAQKRLGKEGRERLAEAGS